MSVPTMLILHLVLLSLISFGGVPAVLPDLYEYIVLTHGWISDREFADCFALVQALPGPNMVLMMSLIGWKIGGLPTAIAAGLAIFVPSVSLAYVVFRWWDRFRDRSWQQIGREGLAPVTIGLVIAGGSVMALAGQPSAAGIALGGGAAAMIFFDRLNPFWLIGTGAALGALGLI